MDWSTPEEGIISYDKDNVSREFIPVHEENGARKIIEVASQFIQIRNDIQYFEAEIMSTSQHRLVVCVLDGKIMLYRIECYPFVRNGPNTQFKYDLSSAIETFRTFFS